MAELICAAVAPALRVVQLVLRLVGIPPLTPAADQSVARLEARIPDQGWPYEVPPRPRPRQITEDTNDGMYFKPVISLPITLEHIVELRGVARYLKGLCHKINRAG